MFLFENMAAGLDGFLCGGEHILHVEHCGINPSFKRKAFRLQTEGLSFASICLIFSLVRSSYL